MKPIFSDNDLKDFLALYDEDRIFETCIEHWKPFKECKEAVHEKSNILTAVSCKKLNDNLYKILHDLLFDPAVSGSEFFPLSFQEVFNGNEQIANEYIKKRCETISDILINLGVEKGNFSPEVETKIKEYFSCIDLTVQDLSIEDSPHVLAKYFHQSESKNESLNGLIQKYKLAKLLLIIETFIERHLVRKNRTKKGLQGSAKKSRKLKAHIKILLVQETPECGWESISAAAVAIFPKTFLYSQEEGLEFTEDGLIGDLLKPGEKKNGTIYKWITEKDSELRKIYEETSAKSRQSVKAKQH